MRRFVLLLVNDLFGTLEMALLLRVILRAFAANPAAPFVAFIYSVTNFLLWPVSYIFPDRVAFGIAVIDMVAIAGMVLYAIVFLILLKFLKVLLGGDRPYF